MKKIFLLLFLPISFFAFSQSVFEAKSTTDRAIVEKFISKNPKHPAVPELKKRLTTLSYGGSTSSSAKPTITRMTEKRIEKTSTVGTSAAKGQPSAQAKNTAAILTNLFDNNPNKKEAVIQIVNKSKCVLVVKINGKKFYNLTVPSNGQNYILVEKGNYNLTTSICDAKYNQNKAITKDIIITLNGG
ncbi:DUF6759 domain-containing protein [Epilithonimonas hispanica]|uniref:DUF6759 domain-containing protein n=1 Tax=Epilithonimonas hispanica TaxID=358687 RepID=A0A3D9CX31_9FLAO|nr:DUF6759 domain-containing protein [Epilithonimonas hispanica]REC70326.1 hypothetical protein DRF58_10115 [Epilithonimonas hispanica]